MTDEKDDEPWEELGKVVAEGDAARLDEFLDTLSGGDAARALARLSTDEQQRVLTTLQPNDAADLIEEIPEAQAVDIVGELPPADAAAILVELSSNQRTDLITALEEEHAEAILEHMEPEEASEVRRLASYPPDVAGGLMSTVFLAYHDGALVRDVVDDLRRGADEIADRAIQYVYILDGERRLVGVLPLRSLLFTPGSRRVSDVMIRDPLTVSDDTSLEDLDEFFARNRFLAAPVVDAARHLAGIVRRDHVEEALGERADSDYLKSYGIVGGEELRTMPLLRRCSRRLSWLSVNIVLNLIAASVIALYQDTLATVIALAVFLPIISDMSGCSGNQAVAVSIRELSLGLVTPLEAGRVWLKEVSVGVLNGLFLGALIGVVAWAWQGNAWFGLVAGIALAANTVVAVSIGGTVPLVLKRMRLDPALASGPILTTLTDMCGFFLALGIATTLLTRLS